MSEPEVKQIEEPVIRKANCQRCKHSWWPKNPERPAVCPECQSPRWDRPRLQRIPAEEGVEPEEETNGSSGTEG